MFKNYVLTAVRKISRHSMFYFITVFGLTLGFATLLILSLHISNELSYDKWLPDHERIFRLETTYSIPGRDNSQRASSMLPLKTFLEQDFGEIEMAARVQPFWISMTYQELLFNEPIVFADKEFLEFLAPYALEGQIQGALDEPASIILTETTKTKYFGAGKAVGKSIIVDGDVPYKVTAVIKDLPPETHLEFSGIAPITAPTFYFRDRFNDRWDVATVHTYIKLREGVSAGSLETGFPEFIGRRIPDFTISGTSLNSREAVKFSLRPVTDIHLKSDDSRNMKPGGNIYDIYGLIAVTLLILAISTINYINLTSAQYTTRWHEVALRKICGARRNHLLGQFLGESILVAFFALGLAFGVAEIGLPYANQFFGKTLTLDIFVNLWPFGVLAGAALIVGFLGAFFPAWIISAASPSEIFSDHFETGLSRGRFRSFLVVLQFAISVGLIVMTLVVQKQTEFVRKLDTGFNLDNRIVLIGTQRGPEETRRMVGALKTEIENHPDILSVSGSSNVPGLGNVLTASGSLLNFQGKEAITMGLVSVDHNFFETFGVLPLAGREFDPAFPADEIRQPDHEMGLSKGGAVINRTAAERFGLTPDQAVGKSLRLTFGQENLSPFEFRIIGVIPDVHMRSARESIEPQVFYYDSSHFAFLTINFSGKNPSEVFTHIEQAWSRVFADQEITRIFADEAFVQDYASAEKQKITLITSAVLATLIACLGLYGVGAFIVERKTREIGVRKVFGAKISDLIKMFSFQFSKPVIWANFIAWPTAWYFSREWLNEFAYRIDLTPMFFIIAGGIALIFAMGAIAGHVVRVARANPIGALRYE